MEFKTLHLLRHGQAYHNVMLQAHLGSFACHLDRVMVQHHSKDYRPEDFDSENCSYYEHHDASLTATGWQQVEELGKRLKVSGARDGIELVVVSPLTRTLQTASGVLGAGNYSKEEELQPLMADKVGRCQHAAISSSDSPPFVAVEQCRERCSGMPCDQRSPTSEARLHFPGIDFSKIKEEDDAWKSETRETEEELDTRTRSFLDFLDGTSEKEIAVVSHGGFLTNMLRKFGDETVDSTMFANCEMRTVKMRKIVTDAGDYTFQLSAA